MGRLGVCWISLYLCTSIVQVYSFYTNSINCGTQNTNEVPLDTPAYIYGRYFSTAPLTCTITMEAERGHVFSTRKLKVEFTTFSIKDPGVTLKMYDAKDASGSPYATLDSSYYYNQRPSVVTTSSPYLTIKLTRSASGTYTYSSYNFDIKFTTVIDTSIVDTTISFEMALIIGSAAGGVGLLILLICISCIVCSHYSKRRSNRAVFTRSISSRGSDGLDVNGGEKYNSGFVEGDLEAGFTFPPRQSTFMTEFSPKGRTPPSPARTASSQESAPPMFLYESPSKSGSTLTTLHQTD